LEKPDLFLGKLAMCCELVDYIASAIGKFPEHVVPEVIRMVSVNLFRVLTPALRENKALESFDMVIWRKKSPAWTRRGRTCRLCMSCS
jgi:serine/threonine-protein phosphatase 2A regulatory subunit B'